MPTAPTRDSPLPFLAASGVDSYAATMQIGSILTILLLSGGTWSAASDTPLDDSRAVRHQVRQESVFDFASLVPPRTADAIDQSPPPIVLERISTVVPWPRGIVLVDDGLIVLSRGRHRSDGGVGDDLVDHAGTLWRVDPSISEPVVPGRPAGEAVRHNGSVFMAPTSPPFLLYGHDRPAEEDRLMDRPYCGLAFDPLSRNIVLCAFAGAELDGGRRFRKHATDGLLRLDLRDGQWRVVERHDHAIVPEDRLREAISNEFHPHHDPARHAPPHGWVNGPTDCAVVGEFLYVTAKDNHLVVQYDMAEIRRRPDAPPPPSRPVLGPRVTFRLPDGSRRDLEVLGYAGVASDGRHLYVGSRTSSVVYRVPVDARGDIVPGAPAELIAIFHPFEIESGRSGNMFDLAMAPDGALLVTMARRGRVWRILPDPANPFLADDRPGRETTAPPFIDLPKHLGKAAGAADLAVDGHGNVYVCARTDDAGEGPYVGTVYRARAAEMSGRVREGRDGP